MKIIVYTAKPGVVIGKGGSEIERVGKHELAQFTDKKLIVDIRKRSKDRTKTHSL